jgi:hypothetical protein
MKKTTGREGNREWTQYGFRFNGKNHHVVIQRTWNDARTNPQWYTFHLEGGAQTDSMYTIKEAPLSRTLAEDFAKQYIREYIKQGQRISIQYDITHKKKIRILQVINNNGY